MKKLHTRFLSLLCAVCLIFTTAAPAFAAEAATEIPPEEIIDNSEEAPFALTSPEMMLYAGFDGMTIQQLNDYIHQIAIGETPAAVNGVIASDEAAYFADPLDPFLGVPRIMAAWLAAAKIFVKAEFPCTSEMVLRSLGREDYSEVDGIFANKIKTTTPYKDWCVAYSSLNGRITFESNDDLDLFLSLHDVGIVTRQMGSGTSFKLYAYITDTFDFDNTKEFGSVAANFINDIGWLLQNAGIFYNTKVTIRITLL